MNNIEGIEQAIWQWLDDVVIGLNLCPFAKKPRAQSQIKVFISPAKKDEALMDDFFNELTLLRDADPKQTDTSLFVTPFALESFDEYLNFLAIANLTVQQMGLEGDFQLASFHPDYQFEGTELDDKENLTNRAPYPVIHIIREATVEKVLEKYPNPELIPENNINRVESLTEEELVRLFPYFFDKK